MSMELKHEMEFVMSANKAKPSKQVPQAVSILLRPQNRGPLLAIAVCIAAIGGLMLAWNRWGSPVLLSDAYVVTPDKLVVTPTPAWIHADIKSEVVKAATLDRLNLNDRELVTKVAQAFALHPWVAKVDRVEKRFPAQVLVTLDYRRPVAAVEIADGGKGAVLFIDAQSVLLPSKDFAPEQAKDYLRIAAGNTAPASVYGEPWGSEQVAGAAQIADAWGERFAKAGMHRILAMSTGEQSEYELRTVGQTRVLWGHAPGHEGPGEPTAEQKIESLMRRIADKGPLDRGNGDRVIDLRAPSSQ
jgi:hypothetical protein